MRRREATQGALTEPMPPLGIAYGLLASLSFGSGDFVGATAARRVGALAVTAGAQASGLVILLVALAVVRPPIPSLEGALISLAAGVAGAIGLAALFGGMAIGKMGLIAALSGAGSLVVPLVAGAVMGVQIAPLQLVGIGAAGTAALAAGGASRGDVGRRALLLAGLAAAGFGSWYVLLDLGARNADPLWTLALSRGAAAVATGIVAFRSFDRRGYPFRIVAAAGVLDIGGNAFYVAARGEMAVGLAAALTGLYPIVTMLLARLIHHERLGPLGYVGVALALTAVVLISIGGYPSV